MQKKFSLLGVENLRHCNCCCCCREDPPVSRHNNCCIKICFFPLPPQVIKEGQSWDDLNELAKLFNIHGKDEE